MKFTDDQKGGIFRTLVAKTFYETGIEFGLDKHYKTANGIKAVVYGIYKEVKSDPQRFAVHPETVDIVIKAVENRGLTKSPTPSLREQKEEKAIAEADIKTLVVSNRNMANKLIHKKLAQLDKSKKALKNESLVTLGKIFGILFDKAQIIQGEATEHVAVLSKIDGSLSPSEAIELVLKMRETNTNNV